MRKILYVPLFFTSILFSSFQIHAQEFNLPYNRETGYITQESVVITGKSKEKSFNLIRSYLAKNYQNYKDIVQIEDVNSGEIIFTGTEPIYSGRFRSFKFTTTIDIKDDKYRCIIDNVRVQEKGHSTYDGFYTSHDMIERYNKKIGDITSQIKNTKKKRELESLNRELELNLLFRDDYIKAHQMMALKFSILQLGIRSAVIPANPIGKTKDF